MQRIGSWEVLLMLLPGGGGGGDCVGLCFYLAVKILLL